MSTDPTSTQMSATLNHAAAKSATQTKDQWFCSKEANSVVIHGDFRWVKEGIEEAIEHISWILRKRGGNLFGKISSIAFTQKQNKAKRGIILKYSIFALVTLFFFFLLLSKFISPKIFFKKKKSQKIKRKY